MLSSFFIFLPTNAAPFRELDSLVGLWNIRIRRVWAFGTYGYSSAISASRQLQEQSGGDNGSNNCCRTCVRLTRPCLAVVHYWWWKQWRGRDFSNDFSDAQHIRLFSRDFFKLVFLPVTVCASASIATTIAPWQIAPWQQRDQHIEALAVIVMTMVGTMMIPPWSGHAPVGSRAPRKPCDRYGSCRTWRRQSFWGHIMVVWFRHFFGGAWCRCSPSHFNPQVHNARICS
jgi:hypothetical protein